MVMCAVKPDLWAGVVKFELLLLVFGGTVPIGAAWSVQSVPFALPLLCAVSQIASGGDSAVFDAGPDAALHVGGARIPFCTLTQLRLRLLRRPRRCCL